MPTVGVTVNDVPVPIGVEPPQVLYQLRVRPAPAVALKVIGVFSQIVWLFAEVMVGAVATGETTTSSDAQAETPQLFSARTK